MYIRRIPRSASWYTTERQLKNINCSSLCILLECNFPMIPRVHAVGLLLGCFVCHNFVKRQESYTSNARFGALVLCCISLPSENHTICWQEINESINILRSFRLLQSSVSNHNKFCSIAFFFSLQRCT